MSEYTFVIKVYKDQSKKSFEYCIVESIKDYQMEKDEYGVPYTISNIFERLSIVFSDHKYEKP